MYLGSSNQLYAIDADDGSHKWRAQTETVVRNNVVVSDGTVSAVDSSKHLYALDAENGDEHWRYELDTTTYHTPALGPDTIYVPTAWSMYAIKR